MQSSSTRAFLHVPVSVAVPGTTLSGRLSIPRTATALGVCIEHPGREDEQIELASQLADIGVATLSIHAESRLSLGDLVSIIDWVRSRRLLRALPIGLIAPGAEGAAALRAAQHRPVAVPAVLVMSPTSGAMPGALRWLRSRLSAPPRSGCRLSAAYSA